MRESCAEWQDSHQIFRHQLQCHISLVWQNTEKRRIYSRERQRREWMKPRKEWMNTCRERVQRGKTERSEWKRERLPAPLPPHNPSHFIKDRRPLAGFDTPLTNLNDPRHCVRFHSADQEMSWKPNSSSRFALILRISSLMGLASVWNILALSPLAFNHVTRESSTWRWNGV